MRPKQALRPCVMLLVACQLAAAVAQPLTERGWKTYQDNRYAFRYPAGLVTTSHPNGVVELHSLDKEFRMRASARTNSENDTVQSAWQQRPKEQKDQLAEQHQLSSPLEISDDDVLAESKSA